MSTDDSDVTQRMVSLSTPLIADACQRLRRECRFAPGVAALFPERPVAGRALPVRHFGSVDVFLEAFEEAQAGDVLVIDNGGRADEGCIGDLTALEAQAAGMSGIVVWGAVRDVPELQRIALPIYCTGRCPLGPQSARPRSTDAPPRIAGIPVTRAHFVVADDDGVLLLASDGLDGVLDAAEAIQRREREQAERLRAGRTLREQLRFADFLEERARRPSYTLREHLERHGGAIEV